MTQGIVALDIDGTMLSHNQDPSPLLIDMLTLMHKEGWKILFATGRTVAWSLRHLENLPVPFFLAAFNGAVLFSFPERKKLHASSLLKEDVLALSPFIDRFGVIAYEMDGDKAFVSRQSCSPFIQEHLLKRKEAQNENWVEFSSVQDLPLVAYASLRFFVMKGNEEFLQQAIQKSSFLTALTMKDSFHSDVKIIQVTAKGVSKGASLRYLCKKYTPLLGTIAAGDDSNDIDLLESADIGIAVGDASAELRKIAYSTAASPEVVHVLLEQAKNLLQKRGHIQ